MNRLSNELSPYLKAHSKNPVNWYPWGEEAFEVAKKEDKPIFLSIGYNNCHWCHIMEAESFENQEIAKILNENFISIKVDKEERPDIDKHFQEIFIQMNGKVGGWPLSIFLTSQKLPIFSATYIPPEDKYGMIGFQKLLKIVAKKYKTQKDEILNSSQEILQALLPKTKIKATKITKDLIKIASSQLKMVYDEKNGGFGEAPKFPRVSALMLAMNLYKLTKDDELLEIVKNSLDKMSIGGFYDLVDGGYCRYSVDEMWLIPHFEKMLYDNGLMIEILVEAYSATNEERFLHLAKATANFLTSKMMNKDKLFFSSIDADSDGFEGGYYIFEFEEVEKAFKEANLPDSLLEKLNITKEGNFEGLNIVRLNSWEDFGDSDIKKALEILRELRAKREFPTIDKKIITSWGAMVIKSLFKLSKIEKSYQKVAKESLEALRNYAGKGSRVYHCGVEGHSPYIDGFLEDYAYLALANIQAYNTTLQEEYLKFAQDLANEAIKRFYKGGKWSLSDSEFKDFADDTDSSYPSAVGVMVDVLLSLKNLKEPIYEKFIYKTLEAHSYDLMRQPISRAKLAEMAIRYLEDDKVIKSNLNSLKPLIDKIDNFNYPWIFLKVDESLQEYLICDSKSCFANCKSADEVEIWFKR